VGADHSPADDSTPRRGWQTVVHSHEIADAHNVEQAVHRVVVEGDQ
jgi:hypothetical protein